jgi:hypothetical protein
MSATRAVSFCARDHRELVHLEALSGVWEASDGRGGAVGILLELTTSLSGDADPPVWTPQGW